MAKNNSNHSEVAAGCLGGCLGFVFILLLLGWISFIFISYVDMKPKDAIKEEIIKKGDKFSVDSEDLSKIYRHVLEDLSLSYKTSKDGDKTIIKINRSNK
jgi:hypothetical protein